tara:strand:- start:304 stop:519 length:216 start_codon:yes stop_codon:yes gene_type:complete
MAWNIDSLSVTGYGDDFIDANENGVWHIKVKGDIALEATLHLNGYRFITHDFSSFNTKLCQLSMSRPTLKI